MLVEKIGNNYIEVDIEKDCHDLHYFPPYQPVGQKYGIDRGHGIGFLLENSNES